MDLSIVGLVFASAALHPLREFFIKGSLYPEGLCLAAMMSWVIFAAIHALILGIDLLSIRAVWPLALASGLAVVFYFSFIVITLREGDFSSYYPITRASPLFIVVVSFLFLNERYSWHLLFGIAMVFCGAFFLQYKHYHKTVLDLLLCRLQHVYRRNCSKYFILHPYTIYANIDH